MKKNLQRLCLPVFFCLVDVTYAAEFDATIELSPQYALSLPVSGVVKSLKVVTGQRVEKGDELLALDATPFMAAKDNALARVSVQKTRLKESQRDLQQQQELYDRTVLAYVDLENAQLREQRDKANLAYAQAELTDANYELSYSKLTAPFDALILSVNVNQGQSINNTLQSKTLVSLVRRHYYEAVFYVTPDVLDKLAIDQPVKIKGVVEQYDGKISSIDYQTITTDKDRTKRFKIAARFVSKGNVLIGQQASVHID